MNASGRDQQEGGLALPRGLGLLDELAEALAIGAGTDAHRVASYNPFTALQWFADGKTVGGVPILGVAYKDRPNEAAAFLNALGNPYEVTGLDANGRFGLDLGIAGVPETFVIGPDGRILAVHRGPLADEAMVAREILPALTPRT